MSLFCWHAVRHLSGARDLCSLTRPPVVLSCCCCWVSFNAVSILVVVNSIMTHSCTHCRRVDRWPGIDLSLLELALYTRRNGLMLVTHRRCSVCSVCSGALQICEAHSWLSLFTGKREWPTSHLWFDLRGSELRNLATSDFTSESNRVCDYIIILN